MSDSRQTLDQRRAYHAWQAVEQAGQLKEEDQKTFAREAKKLPLRIKTAGLGQAVAFLRAKKDEKKKDADPRTCLLYALGNWLLDERRLASAQSGKDDALIKAIICDNADFLRRATEEALLYLQWLTRFAEAEIGIEED